MLWEIENGTGTTVIEENNELFYSLGNQPAFSLMMF